jgi:hypothetical protein
VINTAQVGLPGSSGRTWAASAALSSTTRIRPAACQRKLIAELNDLGRPAGELRNVRWQLGGHRPVGKRDPPWACRPLPVAPSRGATARSQARWKPALGRPTLSRRPTERFATCPSRLVAMLVVTPSNAEMTTTNVTRISARGRTRHKGPPGDSSDRRSRQVSHPAAFRPTPRKGTHHDAVLASEKAGAEEAQVRPQTRGDVAQLAERLLCNSLDSCAVLTC